MFLLIFCFKSLFYALLIVIMCHMCMLSDFIDDLQPIFGEYTERAFFVHFGLFFGPYFQKNTSGDRVKKFQPVTPVWNNSLDVVEGI